MAELSYGDMQRAVQDGLRNIQSSVSQIVNTTSGMQSQTQHIDDVLRAVQEIHQQVSRLPQQAASIDSADDQVMRQISSDVTELKARFAAIEQFASQMSNYINEKHKEDEQDSQFRK